MLAAPDFPFICRFPIEHRFGSINFLPGRPNALAPCAPARVMSSVNRQKKGRRPPETRYGRPLTARQPTAGSRPPASLSPCFPVSLFSFFFLTTPKSVCSAHSPRPCPHTYHQKQKHDEPNKGPRARGFPVGHGSRAWASCMHTGVMSTYRFHLFGSTAHRDWPASQSQPAGKARQKQRHMLIYPSDRGCDGRRQN